MAFQIGSTLLDACVLAVLAQEDTYGYRLTGQLRQVLDISESTLYPVLRRLQKDGAVTSYDRPFDGRNRRYYRLTDKGAQLLRGYREEWDGFRSGIDRLIGAGPQQQQERTDTL
jgi:PadR family transcriptional regulator PadR